MYIKLVYGIMPSLHYCIAMKNTHTSDKAYCFPNVHDPICSEGKEYCDLVY